MNWPVYVALAFVVLSLVIAWVLGRRLPAEHVVALQARYDKPPNEVWKAVTNMMTAPDWRSGVRQVERLPDRDGHQVWIEVGRRGRRPLELEVVAPERKLITRVTGEHWPIGGSWTYELEPDDAGCTLRIMEAGVIRSPTLRFLTRNVIGYDAAVRRYLVDLGKRLGQKVTPQRVVEEQDTLVGI